MLIKDSFTLDAPQAAVWELLQDIPRVSACMPGAQDVQNVSEDAYSGLLKVKIGPISASFSGQVRIVERSAPVRIVAEIDAQDKSSASLVKAAFSGMLTPDGDKTRMDYSVEAVLRGKLGQFGGTVAQATAKKLTTEFAKCLNSLLASSGEAG